MKKRCKKSLQRLGVYLFYVLYLQRNTKQPGAKAQRVPVLNIWFFTVFENCGSRAGHLF